MGTVTSLRRVGGYAGAGLAGLACLTWILVTLNVIVLGTVGSLVVSAVCAAGFGAESAGQAEGGRPRVQAGPDHGRDHRESR